MNQAENRLQGAELREAELVLLATPSEQAHFGPGGEVFARWLRQGQDLGPSGLRGGPARGVQSVAAPRRGEVPCPGELGASPCGRDSAVGAARC